MVGSRCAAALVLVAALAAPVELSARTSLEGLPLSLEALAAADRGTITLTLRDTSLTAALEQLRIELKMPLRADWDALARISVDPDDRVGLDVAGVPPLAALQTLALSLGSDLDRPVIDAAQGQLVLTTLQGLASLRETAIYDVADIVADPTLIEGYATLIAKQAGDEEDDPNPTPIDTTQSVDDRDAVQRVDRLTKLLMEHIDPEGWSDYGGVRGRISSEAGRLIVTATPMTHRQLRALLARLRDESPVSARVGVEVLTIPAATLDKLERETGGDRARLRSAVAEHADATKLWSPTIVARLGEAATIEAEDGPEGRGASFRCRVEPRYDRVRQSLALVLDLELAQAASPESGAEARSGPRAKLQTTIDLPGRRGDSLIRVPQSVDATNALLVLVHGAAESR